MKSYNNVAIALLVTAILITFTNTVYADRNVPAMPEIQGLSTSTDMNVQGTITETDAGAWSVNANGIPVSGYDPIVAQYDYTKWPDWSYSDFLAAWAIDQANWPGMHVQDLYNYIIEHPGDYTPEDVQSSYDILNWLQNQGSPLTPPLQDQEEQYTTGYTDQLTAVSGQSVVSKSMAISTGNTIPDQSNIKADTSLQFVAGDSGRATRTEDLLLDGAAQASNTADAILCPFALNISSVIPAYCNIVQTGSSLDATATSMVTHADNRFVGADSTFPVVVNYQINAEGFTIANQSSPMVGSVSAYLNVHVQEARNESTGIVVSNDIPVQITENPQKSEDLVYAETSSASGLISHFSKSMSYQSGFNLI